jgi:anti-anti-sigma regulatory factor
LEVREALAGVIEMSTQRKMPRKPVTIVLRGPLTLGPPAEKLRNDVRSLLERGVKEICIDARRVPYADGRGLGILAECIALARRAGATVKVERARGKFRQELQITHLLAARSPRRVRRAADARPASRSFRAHVKSYVRMLEPGVA